MRIVHLVSRSHRRGAENVALELAEELDALGHANRVVALAPALDGRTDPALPPLVSQVKLRLGMRARCSLELRRFLAREPADVLLAHGGWAAQVAALGLGRKRPTVVWQRILGFPDDFWHPAKRLAWKAISRRVDAVAALTADEADEMRALGYDGPVWVISNFRRPERFVGIDRRAESARLRDEIGIDAATPLIGFVGHLVEQKRPERTIEVLAGVRDRGLPAHLVVAGDGPLRSDLENETRARGLERSVTLLGHRSDVEHVFGGVDVVLLTSDAEGIPGVAIEATMTGCPVVTFPVGGVSEVIDQGVTGIVLDRSDTDLMAESVAGLLADEARRTSMGTEARRRAPQFSAEAKALVYADRLAECHAARTGHALSRRSSSRHASTSEQFARRGPNLLVIGAPRSGTTFVYNALRIGEGVYMSPVKEPGFFNSSRNYDLGINYYLDAFFSRAEGHPLRGEATPWYLYGEVARERIAALRLAEPPRSIVLVRRPAARAFSMWRDQRRIGAETRTFEAAVESELAGLERGDLVGDVRRRYLWCGLYREHIEAWQREFGGEHLHVIVFEELIRNPAKVWAGLTAFLEHDLGPAPFAVLTERDKNPAGDLRFPRLDHFIRSFEGRHNPVVETAKRVLPPGLHRKVLQRFSQFNRETTSRRPVEVDPALMADLDAFFRAENQRLAQHLGRDLSFWERVPVG